ncbi:MAG TPA: YbhB/YbcL family Raf kinase inhibitor-like protein [Rhizomicrobium sp.]|nr:YbhB/YbcL family Raf kinase inhibitor-like protein [Rhizomicrobium sp.]
MVNDIRKTIAALSLVLAAILISCPEGWAMNLTSPDFANGARLSLVQVNARCGGRNRSPALGWSGAPAGTQSYALTLFDPDADGGRGFWHWLVFDIPASAAGLPEGAGSGTGLPRGAMQAANDFGDVGYGGACPPPGSGTHHYEFTLYALGVAQLPSEATTNGAALAAWLKAHALATASRIATYSR